MLPTQLSIGKLVTENPKKMLDLGAGRSRNVSLQDGTLRRGRECARVKGRQCDTLTEQEAVLSSFFLTLNLFNRPLQTACGLSGQHVKLGPRIDSLCLPFHVSSAKSPDCPSDNRVFFQEYSGCTHNPLLTSVFLGQKMKCSKYLPNIRCLYVHIIPTHEHRHVAVRDTVKAMLH